MKFPSTETIHVPPGSKGAANRHFLDLPGLLNLRERVEEDTKRVEEDTSWGAGARRLLMPSQSFRFLHAGGFRLEGTLRGLEEAPQHLLETLVHAPFLAAEQVFAAAAREEVDFVLLSGDLLDPTLAGPRAIAFLVDKFQSLNKLGIPVYWAASERDLAQGWLRDWEWPTNVKVFSSERVEWFPYHRGGHTIARIAGRSWQEGRRLTSGEVVAGLAAEKTEKSEKSEKPERAEKSDLPTVVVTAERLEVEPRAKGMLRYWALGGPRVDDEATSGKCQVHAVGSPQGLSLDEPGPHGCALVQVAADGEPRLRTIATDVVRWCVERIQVLAGAARDTVHQELRSRVQTLVAESSVPLLVSWKVSGLGRFDSRYAREQARQETLDWLRRQFGYGTPACWSINFDLEPPHALRAEWCEEDSILGDFMRVIRDYQDDPRRMVRLEPFLPDRKTPRGVSSSYLTTVDEEDREELLNLAALRGLDLLRGDDLLPHDPAGVRNESQRERVTT